MAPHSAPRIVFVPPSHADVAELTKKMGASGFDLVVSRADRAALEVIEIPDDEEWTIGDLWDRVRSRRWVVLAQDDRRTGVNRSYSVRRRQEAAVTSSRRDPR
jgi:hypothetical protein